MSRFLTRSIVSALTLCVVALGAGVGFDEAASSSTPEAPDLGVTPQHAPALSAPLSAVGQSVAGLRVMNYFPSTRGWDLMWVNWDPARIDADFGRIAALGANTVRVIITEPSNFGYPTPSAARMFELQRTLEMAAAHGLKVMLTLSGSTWWEADLGSSRAWTGALLAPFRGDQRIALVELQNEVDPSKAAQIAFVSAMLPAIRSQSDRPVSVSVTASSPASLGLDTLIRELGSVRPDVFDIHYYGHADLARAVFERARDLAGATPLLIGETGYSTYVFNDSEHGLAATQTAREWYQAQYYRIVEQAARDAGLPPAAPWTLTDFPASPTVPNLQQHFGLYRLDGSAKPAIAAVAAAFAGAPLGAVANWRLKAVAGSLPAGRLLSSR